jgi:hypothetical protein
MILTDAQKERMRNALLAIRDDRPASIVITRNGEELAAQTVRIARVARGRTFQSGQGREQRADVIVMGAVDFNVQVNDDFTDEGTLYRIVFIRPNRDSAVTAEAIGVQ